jgi:flagellar FliL protein
MRLALILGTVAAGSFHFALDFDSLEDFTMAEAPPAAPAPDPKPRSKKMLLIVIAAVVVLVGGGVGAYFAFGDKGEEQSAEQGKDGKEKGKGKKGEVVKKGPAIYVKLDPPFVVNFDANGVMRFLQVTVEVMTRDPAAAELIKSNDPMIRNDLLLLFGNQQSSGITTLEGKEKLRADALAVVAKVVSAEGGDGKKVEQLFFTSFVMQ